MLLLASTSAEYVWTHEVRGSSIASTQLNGCACALLSRYRHSARISASVSRSRCWPPVLVPLLVVDDDDEDDDEDDENEAERASQRSNSPSSSVRLDSALESAGSSCFRCS